MKYRDKLALCCLTLVAIGLTQIARADVFYSTGFETYTPGSVVGQDGWQDDTLVPGGEPPYGEAQVIADPTGEGHGQVLAMDPPGVNAGGWLGAFRPLGLPVTDGVVLIAWDQYKADLGDNVWFADDISFNGWWGIQWDVSHRVHATQNFGDPSEELTANAWQRVAFLVDITNHTVEGFLNGVSYGNGSWAGAAEFRGIDLEVSPTERDGEGGPVYFDNIVIGTSPEGDTDLSGCVDDGDITNVILDFGAAQSGNNGQSDINDDGIVDDADLTLVILAFGNGC